MKKGFLLKAAAAAAMLQTMLPAMLFCDAAAFGSLDFLRLFIYFLLSPVPVLLGYFTAVFRATRTNAKFVATANVIIVSTALALAVLVIVGTYIADLLTDDPLNVFFISLSLIPSVLVWFRLGMLLYRKSFSDIFTLPWLGIYLVGTFMSFGICAVRAQDAPVFDVVCDILSYQLIVMSMLTVLLINQSNIESQINLRKNINLIVPRGLQLHNAKLISAVGVIILVILAAKDWLASLLQWFVSTALKLFSALINLTGATSDSELPSPDPSVNAGDTSVLYENRTDFTVFIVIIVSIILAIIYRKKICAFFRSVAQRVFKKISSNETEEQHGVDYTDYYERLQENSVRITKESASDIMKAYKKEKDNTKKYRLGYRLYIMWLSQKSISFKKSDTVEQHERQAEKHYLGNSDIGALSDSYNRLRYNDNAPTESDRDAMNALIKELY